MTFGTVKGKFSTVNQYLKYYKIRGNFAEDIIFPQNTREERYAIFNDEVQKIIESVKPKQKCYYLCLISSGCRPIDALGLKKKNFFWTGKQFGARIPAILTKKKIFPFTVPNVIV